MSIQSKSLIISISFIYISINAFAQEDHNAFCERSYKTSNTGMIILGSWAVANIATGVYGWSKYSDHKKYFHQMNFFWNTVNLSIAGIALYSNAQVDCSLLSSDAIMSKHNQTEKILLINSALDAGYIGAGLLMRHFSTRSTQRSNLLKGYGNSVVVQGAFLLVFDLILYATMRTHRVDFLNQLSLSPSPEFTGVQLVFML